MKIDYHEVFSSPGEAQVFIQNVYAQYAPQGYGTSLRWYEHELEHDGLYKTVYVVEGYRYDSCD